MRTELIGLGTGALVGLVVSWGVIAPWLTRTFTNVPPAIHQESVSSGPCEARMAPLRQKRDALLGEWKALAPKVLASKTFRTSFEGQKFPWPEDVSSVFRKPAVELLVNGAIERSGERLEAVTWSCDEYPCVVVLEGRRQRYFDAFLAALTERGFLGVEILTRGTQTVEGATRYVWLLSYWDEASGSEALRDRVSVRMDAMMAPYMEEREAGDAR